MAIQCQVRFCEWVPQRGNRVRNGRSRAGEIRRPRPRLRRVELMTAPKAKVGASPAQQPLVVQHPHQRRPMQILSGLVVRPKAAVEPDVLAMINGAALAAQPSKWRNKMCIAATERTSSGPGIQRSCLYVQTAACLCGEMRVARSAMSWRMRAAMKQVSTSLLTTQSMCQLFEANWSCSCRHATRKSGALSAERNAPPTAASILLGSNAVLFGDSAT
eukprot:CAMPEP_0181183986 /NCGR_PEP_ID=MMETSP1096-20121128/8723_1 /TAXON_ID=156174 ORGANISM="Chrysochromulina ericina, Strain CCMP281" /NCGR_SAMPLE_ID=MMETSP1096 /ASSEMBLY_ACC=CAM_ASM_000453 /LENGTH=216 /DNA_ID=CAMNT_0023272713 /DNA_START=216 /DNA_END=867 /DNA_ORIENTATION=+